MDSSPSHEARAMDSPDGSSANFDRPLGAAAPAAGGQRRAERLAWFVCGGGLALVMGAVLGPAFATSPPASSAATATPALLLPSGFPVAGPSTAGSLAANQDGNQAGTQSGLRPIPMTANGMSADSNNRMIAVTGVDITGQSVLYLIDTIDKQLAVYQASGGAPGTNSVRLVGARRIDLDLQLSGFNDKTETGGKSLTYEDLEKKFSKDVDGR